MKKILRCLALTVMLVFLFSSAAMAVDALNIFSVGMDDKGNLDIYAGTDYTDTKDMNFSASTENGPLKISGSLVLNKEGTSWFIVLDYHRSIHYKQIPEIQDRVLADLAGIIQSKDEGALVLSNYDPSIHVEQSSTLKENLVKTPGSSDSSALVVTMGKVMDYISSNRQNLMPNVAVVVITSALEAVDLQEAERILQNHRLITTHIICTLPSEATAGAARRETGYQLQNLAKLTIGGTGYITEKLSKDEADNAVTRIAKNERRKIFIVIDPEKAGNAGKKLTITQTTAGGKELADTVDLSDDDYKQWTELIGKRDPDPVPSDTPDIPSIVTKSSSNSAARARYYEYEAPQEESKGGFSTELLIGIILAAVVIALAVVLILTRKGKGKGKGKKGQAVSAYVDSGASAKPAAVTVTLSGDNGAVLKGQMKNNRLTIGRDASRGAMIAVPNDGKLSGLHATLTKQGNTMTLTDNGSTNGTKVNGSKVTGPVTLKQNDTITMGSATYTVTWR